MMREAVPGLAGTLLSPGAAGAWLSARGGDAGGRLAGAIAQWAEDAMASLGPATSQRRLLESLEGLARCDLGFVCRSGPDVAIASPAAGDPIVLAAAAWGRAPALRAVVRGCVDAGASWALVFNGESLAIVDARANAPRRIARLSLAHLAARARSAAFAAAILDARAADRGVLAEVVDASDEASREVQTSLRAGVRQALDALTGPLPFDASVIVLFRLLFVLFAEARALVPVWHAVYRDHYSLDALARRPLPADSRGIWAALEASRRLLGDGYDAGALRVPAFNGRLFRRAGPRRWSESLRLESRLDRPAAHALAALVTYRPSSGGAHRVNYAELDVEELGSIYERILDLDPAGEGRARKESGSFYTPRPLTELLVRRTLAPLVAGATPERILSLRVLDPAMGSGAFLVAALRYLAAAVERARIDAGTLHEGDVTDGDRQDIRRLVAQRCLYGVDANPTAVMLAKLSVWLATLAPGKPLTFLDHHLKCGNSLAGSDPEHAAGAPGVRAPRTRLPLFDGEAYRCAAATGAARFAELGLAPEDTITAVRQKEKRYAAFNGDAAPLSRWRLLCDAWCAWWFMPPGGRPDAREYRALAAVLTGQTPVLSRRVIERRLREVAAVHRRERFFHWPLEFPDICGASTGPDARAQGFDAIIGNPPWEMLRAEAGSGSRGPLKAFARDSGLYRRGPVGHLNLYQLFVERALQLTRDGGRVGLVLPWGLMTDEGSAALRRRLLDGTAIDTLLRFDNRAGLFNAHRSLRFAALTATTGASTSSLDLARVPAAASLDDFPDSGLLPGSAALSRAALASLSGPALRIPDAPDAGSLALAVRLAARHPALGDSQGWGVTFGRELNLTDDRRHFSSASRGMPVLEGKHITPFHADASAARHHISRASARRLLGDFRFDCPRLAYRDVTAPTNRQALIAAIIPAGCVTGHSLYCLKEPAPDDEQRALCAIFNSSVANFLIRLFVGAHVTTRLIEWLPVPGKAAAVARLGRTNPGRVPRAHLDALVCELYGLTPDERALLSR